MASYGTVQRPSTLGRSGFASGPQPHPDSTRRASGEFNLFQSFNIPPSIEAAAIRAIRNLGYFRAYYYLLIYSILFVSLVPRRRISLLFLVATNALACLYLLLLRAVPDSVILHKIIRPHLVLASLVIAIIVELILTHAGIHLLVSLAIGVPIILAHAVLRRRDDLFENEAASAAGELVPLVDKKASDLESPDRGSKVTGDCSTFRRSSEFFSDFFYCAGKLFFGRVSSPISRKPIQCLKPVMQFGFQNQP